MSGGGKEQTTKQEVDPRMAALLYGAPGDAGKGGLYGMATKLALENPSGINSRMRQGLDQQYNYLSSPQYTQMMQAMMGQGQNLMGRGVAGNPFNQGGSQGGGSFSGGFGGRQGGMGGMGFAPSYLPKLQQSSQAQSNTPDSQNMMRDPRRDGSFVRGSSMGGMGFGGGNYNNMSGGYNSGNYAPVEDHSSGNYAPVEERVFGSNYGNYAPVEDRSFGSGQSNYAPVEDRSFRNESGNYAPVEDRSGATGADPRMWSNEWW